MAFKTQIGNKVQNYWN